MTLNLIDALKKKLDLQKEQDNSVIIVKKGERNLMAQREKRRQRLEEERKERGYKKLRKRNAGTDATAEMRRD